MSLVSIITVVFNQPDVTNDFLKSIAKSTQQNRVEVILVDNGSDDNYEKIFSSTYSDLKYIRSETNLGFAGGNNLGIQYSSGEFLLFINNDTELTEGCIDIMVSEFSNNPRIGLLSPLILYHEDKRLIQYAGLSKMNYLTARNKTIGYKYYDTNQYKSSQETGFAHGAAMMCKKEDLDKVGAMDEGYFLYYEELDWCEKFRRAGKQIWFTGKTKIYHKESISVGKESTLKTYFMYRNRFLFIRKNTGALTTFIFGLYYLLVVCPKDIITYYLGGKKNLIPWLLRGVSWNFNNSKNSTFTGFKIN